jgi:hypothetical protein
MGDFRHTYLPPQQEIPNPRLLPLDPGLLHSDPPLSHLDPLPKLRLKLGVLKIRDC